MPRYSLNIIVPHYNNTEFLARLLTTIPQAENIKTIVVDDCSPAEAQTKLLTVEAQFPNVTFLKLKENGGGGYARNKGLEIADCDYVMFADCDDFFLPTLKWTLDKYLNTEKMHDMVFFDALSVNSTTYVPSKRTRRLKNCYAGKDKEVLFKLKYLFGEPWCRLIRRGLLEEHSIRFEETTIHNDARFAYMTGFYAGDAVADGAVVYSITDREDSVSKVLSWEKIKCRMRIFSEKKKFLNAHNIKVDDFFLTTTLIYALKSKSLSRLEEYYKACREYNISILYMLGCLPKMAVEYIQNYFKG